VAGLHKAIGLIASTTVTTDVQVEVSPLAFTLVRVTMLVPKSAQVNVDCDKLMVIPQLFPLTLLMSVAEIVATPVPSKLTVIG